MKLDLIYIYIYIFGKSYQNVFVYFQKLVFGNIKKKQFSCIFEIKNMLGQLKLKRQFFEEKKIENAKICCYQNLNSNTNSINETDLLN